MIHRRNLPTRLLLNPVFNLLLDPHVNLPACPRFNQQCNLSHVLLDCHRCNLLAHHQNSLSCSHLINQHHGRRANHLIDHRCSLVCNLLGALQASHHFNQAVNLSVIRLVIHQSDLPHNQLPVHQVNRLLNRFISRHINHRRNRQELRRCNPLHNPLHHQLLNQQQCLLMSRLSSPQCIQRLFRLSSPQMRLPTFHLVNRVLLLRSNRYKDHQFNHLLNPRFIQ